MSDNHYNHNDIPEHEINTGLIFQYLDRDDRKWKKISRDFLINIFQPALENTLTYKKVFTVKYNGENGEYLEGYREHRYPRHLELAENENHFPFPDYFLRPDSNSAHWNIINYGEACPVEKGDYHYDLFFALQFFVTDIINDDKLEADNFLEYHLNKYYNNNIEEYALFLDRLCLKYKEFLQDKHVPLAKRFVEKKHSEVLSESDIENISKNNNKIKLNWQGQSNSLAYLFRQLKIATNKKNEPLITNSYEDIASFIKDNFEGFDDIKLSTLITQLRKNSKPQKANKKIELLI